MLCTRDAFVHIITELFKGIISFNFLNLLLVLTLVVVFPFRNLTKNNLVYIV